MTRKVRKNTRWDERRSTVVYAVRSTTFNSWKMLTVGSDYDTWAQLPRGGLNRRAVELGDPESCGDTEVTGGGDTEVTGGGDTDMTYYDSVQELDEVVPSSGGKSSSTGGLCHIIKKHDDVNRNSWSDSTPRQPLDGSSSVKDKGSP